MSQESPKEVAFFGPTGGCTLAALKLALESGFRCSALARRPESLRTALSGVPADLVEKNLTIITGDIQTPSAVLQAIQSSANPSLPCEVIISGIGGAPKFRPNPFRPSLDNPHVCQQAGEAILAAVGQLKGNYVGEWRAPLLAVISSTGLVPGEIPFLMRPLYAMLRIPHDDKAAMERAVEGAEEGLVKWVIVRPGLLTGGGSGRAVRAGYDGRKKNGDKSWGDVEGMAVGYSISRADVGRWIHEEVVVKSGGEWVGKRVSLVY